VINDLGGHPEHFGLVKREANDGAFHAEWERRVFGMSMQGGAAVIGRNVDAVRAAMERLEPAVYFESYWGRWLGALEGVLLARRFLAPGEVDDRVAGRAPREVGAARPSIGGRLFARTVPLVMRPLPRFAIGIVTRSMSGSRHIRRAPRFLAGEEVRAIATRPPGHTRIPGYVCGKRGTIVAHHGGMAFPDTRARFEGDSPQYLYAVRFDGHELWGRDADPASNVCVDLFESYLEALP
jgi:nitrile hydratase beta subunit